MPHRLRYVPPGPNGYTLIEITIRCIQGRYLLRPSKRLNSLVVGVLARAQRSHPVRVHGCVFMSNHAHLLVSVASQKQLSSFMNFVNSNTAREVNRLHDWSDKLWARRYAATPVVGGEGIAVARLRYLLSQGTKEGLVDSPLRWPGVHCAKALANGESLKGIWIDRTGLYEARQKLGPEKVRAIDFEEEEPLELHPLPCWEHLSDVEYRQEIRSLINDLEASSRLSRHGDPVAGRRSILCMHPHYRPKKLKRSLNPRVHAPSKEIRLTFLEVYRLFTRAFLEAADLLRKGDLRAQFPEGSFPPALPFMEATQGPRPG